MLLLEGRDQIVRDIWVSGWRAFEPPVPDVFGSLAAAVNGQAILDVGANTGFYSLVAASCSPHSAVHAFEPLPQVAAVLRDNVALNSFSRRVRVHEEALGSGVGQARLYIPTGEHGLIETSASLSPTFKERHAAEVWVPLTTVDAWRVESGCGRIGLLKVDVESQEHLVLDGARSVLTRDRPAVLIEVLPGIAELDALNSIRIEAGYVDIRLWGDPSAAHFEVTEAVVADSAGWNHLLVPSERLDWAVDTIEAAIRLALDAPTDS